MNEWKNLVEYCHNPNIPLFYREKHVTGTMEDESSQESDQNGINFAPLCTTLCFGKSSGCAHERKKVQINTVGQYVLFPSKWYHQGFYNDHSGIVFLTAQLFARPSISPDSWTSLRSTTHSNDQMIEGWLEGESISVLGSDILVNWDTTYSLEHFKPCKDFYGEVDMECNRQLPSTKFDQVPLIKKLVDQFCHLYPHLSIDQVWLIVKSKRGSGFQEWHRDFYLSNKITRTIVINLGSMKRSDVPGEAFAHLQEFPQDDKTTLEETLQLTAQSDLKTPPETLQVAVQSDLKSPPETLLLTADLKSMPESSTITKVKLIAPSDRKSLLETSTIREVQLPVSSELKSPPETSTIRDDKTSTELVDFEYCNDRTLLNKLPVSIDYGQTIFCLSFPSRDRATAPGRCE
jgi:hypothetical protein